MAAGPLGWARELETEVTSRLQPWSLKHSLDLCGQWDSQVLLSIQRVVMATPHPRGPVLSNIRSLWALLCCPQLELGFGASRCTKLHRSWLTKERRGRESGRKSMVCSERCNLKAGRKG